MTYYTKEKPETIQAMFGSIADNYDRANGILSLRMHRSWNSQLVNLIIGKTRTPLLLDLCSGTGDIAFDWLGKSFHKKEAILLDFCQEMLDCAKIKAEKAAYTNHKISYIQADAHHLPLEDNLAPAATMAYGIRNLNDPLKAMKEVHRVLKPGGVYGILELTRPENKVVRFGHEIYLKNLLPLLGKMVTKNKEAYDYLCGSIEKFTPPQKLEELLKEAGFSHTERHPLTFGIATIILATK